MKLNTLFSHLICVLFYLSHVDVWIREYAPFTWFGCKYPQIKAESLHMKHILFVSFQIHCGGV